MPYTMPILSPISTESTVPGSRNEKTILGLDQEPLCQPCPGSSRISSAMFGNRTVPFCWLFCFTTAATAISSAKHVSIGLSAMGQTMGQDCCCFRDKAACQGSSSNSVPWSGLA